MSALRSEGIETWLSGSHTVNPAEKCFLPGGLASRVSDRAFGEAPSRLLRQIMPSGKLIYLLLWQRS